MPRKKNHPEMNHAPHRGEMVLYRSAQGAVQIQCLLQNETLWLTQKVIAELFGVETPAISKHLANIYESGELNQAATLSILETVQTEGARQVTRKLEYYTLDAIIAVGYRVNSYQATQFRIWATGTLKEFIIKGFVLDDERLKQGKTLFGKDYFNELLERIREIRASERRFYLKITDIYEQCSIDYDPNAPITRQFFQTVQNKLHWAITGQTAAEIIAGRADESKPAMGLTTWKNAPHGKILKSDVLIAKNYLIENEIKELERIVTMFLDYAENQASRHISMKMSDWVTRLDAFLKFNEYEVLTGAGKVSAEVAHQLAAQKYEEFRIRQDREFEGDFEKEIKRIQGRHRSRDEGPRGKGVVQ